MLMTCGPESAGSTTRRQPSTSSNTSWEDEMDFGIDSIEMAHAFEGYACDISRAARDTDIKQHGVDMCRLRMEARDYRLPRAQRRDPGLLWHEHVAKARVALGASAS